MRNTQIRKVDGKELREKCPNSLFLDEVFDNTILDVNEDGSVMYHHYELLYAILDIHNDEFVGADYEHEKYEFTDNFIDFYDMYDEQLQMELSHYETQYENGISNLIPPVLIIVEPDYTAAE